MCCLILETEHIIHFFNSNEMNFDQLNQITVFASETQYSGLVLCVVVVYMMPAGPQTTGSERHRLISDCFVEDKGWISFTDVTFQQSTSLIRERQARVCDVQTRS